MPKIANIFLIIFALFSCAYNPNKAHQEAFNLFKNKGFVQKIFNKNGFNIFVLEKITKAQKPLRIYIEGDGFAYANKSRPSIDPTPRSNFLFDLILLDDSENLLYVARPCQYVDSEKCEEKYWTQDRFSSEIIEVINAVINKYENYEIELVGYSGGAFIAMQLKQKNIKNLRTIAGNLDLDAFVNFHNISAINAPNLNYQDLTKLPQMHFIGANDEIIPLEIFLAYQKKLKNKNCVNLKSIGAASHYQGFDAVWKDLLKLEARCL
jgi:hypothetical protein